MRLPLGTRGMAFPNEGFRCIPTRAGGEYSIVWALVMSTQIRLTRLWHPCGHGVIAFRNHSPAMPPGNGPQKTSGTLQAWQSAGLWRENSLARRRVADEIGSKVFTPPA